MSVAWRTTRLVEIFGLYTRNCMNVMYNKSRSTAVTCYNITHILHSQYKQYIIIITTCIIIIKTLSISKRKTLRISHVNYRIIV